jgi:penicillin-binding protein 2
MLDGRDSVRHRAFTRRTILLGSGVVGLFGLLTARMYQLSVLDSDQYLSLAEDNRVNLQLLAPTRGRIFDRTGAEIARNELNLRVLLVPEQIKDVNAALEQLSQIIPLTDKQKQRALKDISRSQPFKAVLVAEGLSWDDFVKINVNAPNLIGIEPSAGEMRAYPTGPELGHVLGYVGGVTDKDIQEDPQLLSLPGFRLGRAGLERFADKRLRGQAGAAQVEVNAHGRVIRELARKPGVPGEDLVLTLDASLQKMAQERLYGQSGSAVVMDVRTGDVIVLVSAPGFDPNAFNTGPSAEVWKALMSDPLKPLLNKAVGGVYPPGSTFKPVTALAGLLSGAMTPETVVHCSGTYYLGRSAFHCWKRGGHGSVSMETAIKLSCDCYFYECGHRAGIDAIHDVALRLGLGLAYDSEIPGAKAGLVPSPQWKRDVRKAKWTQGETLNVAIGQGALQTTPMQLCVMAARVANGGYPVLPRLVRPAMEPRPVINGLAPIDPKFMQIVHDGMDAVTNEGGTAARSRIAIAGFEMAGKTGTAQVRRITGAERAKGVRKNEDLPWELRDHALFIAYAPVTKPKYAISVVVDHGGGGSKIAAPIARDIMMDVLSKDPSGKPVFHPPPRPAPPPKDQV